MKKSKLAASVALTPLAFVGAASAQTKILIAGANGDRTVTQTAIGKLLTNAKFEGTNADATKANFGVWTGKFQGTSVKIKVAFIGATGGIAAVAGSKTVGLPTDAKPTLDPTVAGNPSDLQIPHFTTSTNFQSTSPFNGTYQGVVYGKLKDTIVGVVGLKWLGSPGIPITNFTTLQSQYLYRNGKAPLPIFTGKQTDKHKAIFAIGRNFDAGQRYGALLESGLASSAVVKHYKPVITGQVANSSGVLVGGTVTSHSLWPIETVSGQSSKTLGNSGFNSGANLAPALTVKLGPAAYKIGNGSATAGYYIGYLTYADAANIAIPAGAKELTWNGVKYSDAAIAAGQYTFWPYTHILYKNSLAGVPRTFADALATQIKTVDAEAKGSGIFLSKLTVKRTVDGGIVSPTYF